MRKDIYDRAFQLYEQSIKGKPEFHKMDVCDKFQKDYSI